MLAALTAVAVLASSAYAQSFNISGQCQSTLAGIAGSSDGACLNAPGLVAAFATTSQNASLVGPVNTWLTGLCGQPACSNATIANIVNNVTTGCATDLAPTGLQPSDVPTIVAEAQRFYPIAREVVCLKNTTSNQLCVTDILNAVQSATGPLSEGNLVNVVTEIINGGLGGSALPKQLLCSDCVKQAINIVNTDVPGLFSSSELSQLSSACGANFTDGKQPTDVTQSAAGASSGSNSSGALASFPLTSIALSLGALASTFAFLA